MCSDKKIKYAKFFYAQKISTQKSLDLHVLPLYFFDPDPDPELYMQNYSAHEKSKNSLAIALAQITLNILPTFNMIPAFWIYYPHSI